MRQSFFHRAVREKQGGDVRRPFEAGPFGTDVVGDEHVEVLLLELLRTVFDDVRRFSGKTDQGLMGLALAQAIEDIGILGHFEGQGIVVLLNLVFCRMSRTVIGNRCRFDDQVTVIVIGVDGGFHVARTADIDAAGQAEVRRRGLDPDEVGV